MKPKSVIKLVLVFLVVLAVNDALLLAGRVLAQEPEPKSSESPDAIVSSSFNYQGQLTSTTGAPIAGPCDFAFLLYNLQSGGSPVADPQFKTNQPLKNGTFTVTLDFGSSIFDGTAYWMAISVACPSGSAYVPFPDRVALSAVPYAHSLRPGATIKGTTTNYMVNIVNQGTGDGLRASSSATQSNYAAVYGSNNSTGSGVYGYNSGGGYGVYGNATAGGYGLYSSGNTHIDGFLSWRSLTSYVSVSAAAFTPVENTQNYRNYGSYLMPKEGTTQQVFNAPIQLPHGAVVTQMELHYYDEGNQYITCSLVRNEWGDYPPYMAETYSAGNTGWGSIFTTDIENAVIDNENYAYLIRLIIPVEIPDYYNLYGVYGVVITYNIIGPY